MADVISRKSERGVSVKLSENAEAARDLIAALGEDDAELNHDMVEGETGLLEALDAALTFIDDCEIIADGCAAKEAQLVARRKAAEARRDRIRARMEQAICRAGLDGGPLKRPTATLSVRNMPAKPVITDEALVPAKFWKQPDPVLDKKAIADAFKAEEEIPGVGSSGLSTSLTIRRA